jgi:hypothetical protein
MKRNLAVRYRGRFGEKLFTEDGEIGFPPPGDTGRHDARCLLMLLPTWQEGLQQSRWYFFFHIVNTARFVLKHRRPHRKKSSGVRLDTGPAKRNRRLKEMAGTGQACSASVVLRRSTRCCQVSSSSANYCVIYNHYLGASSEWIILYNVYVSRQNAINHVCMSFISSFNRTFYC